MEVSKPWFMREILWTCREPTNIPIVDWHGDKTLMHDLAHIKATHLHDKSVKIELSIRRAHERPTKGLPEIIQRLCNVIGGRKWPTVIPHEKDPIFTLTFELEEKEDFSLVALNIVKTIFQKFGIVDTNNILSNAFTARCSVQYWHNETWIGEEVWLHIMNHLSSNSKAA